MYIRAFKPWKLADEGRRAEKIKASVRKLQEAEIGVELGGEDKAELVQQLRDQAARLLNNLKLVAGNKIHEDFCKELEELGASRRADRDAKNLSRKRKADHDDAAEFAATDKGAMTNEEMAHAMLLNPLFSLQAPNNDVDGLLTLTKLRNPLLPLFWSELERDVAEKRGYDRVLKAFEVMNTHISSIFQGNNPPSNLVIDVESIRDQFLDARGLLTGVLGPVVARMCPIFDSIKPRMQSLSCRSRLDKQKQQVLEDLRAMSRLVLCA